MLGLFGAKAREPIVIERVIAISAPVDVVFDLLDFSSPANLLRACGYEFQENAFGLSRYCATHPDAEGVVYHFEVDDLVPNMAIGFRSWLDTEENGSVVTGSRSDYALVGIGEDGCRLELRETAAVKPGASKRAAAREAEAMGKLVEAHLARLKLVAEYGADADVAAA